MTRWKARVAGVVVLALALCGCASEDEMAVRKCGQLAYIPDWNQCIEAYNAKVAARQTPSAAAPSTDWNAVAPLLLLGGTAFLNGYNQARPVTTTCFTTGMMTQCQ
jgi:hypothetical protein